MLLFGGSIPFLRTSSFFRWSELLIQLNSLVNPILYCFALNRNFRNAALEMTKIRKPNVVQLATISNFTAVKRRDRRIAAAEFLEEVQEFHEEEEQPDRISRVEPWDLIELADSICQMPHCVNNQLTEMERAMPPSSREQNQVVCVYVHPTNSKRRQLYSGVTTDSQSQTEVRSDENLPSHNNTPTMNS